ncbi:MAG: dipeptide/oligopeptide/nickel ABC transporter ATP-binding protein [Anaerolineaceae bacterium]|nr:dipeptide/oligopeptide/nickel ABC transporter ATP-binding protein [Anaerolineaceae bacterium]
MATENDMLLDVRGLKAHFYTREGVVKAVDGVDFSIRRNEILAIVGESGSGKSITARAIMNAVPSPGHIIDGQVMFYNPREGGKGVDLAQVDPRGEQIRQIRGNDIAMIFQEPMASLSPVHTIGTQITEAIRLHMPLSKKAARDRAIELLQRVGIPRPEQRIDNYAFQLSGGMRQRAMIAMALSCNPTLLIADEPTTALDVTTQAQILDLMLELQAEYGMSVIFITHDLGVVAEIADDVVVMYLGQVVERGDVYSIFKQPEHPYTRALLQSIPRLGTKVKSRLASIRGMVPSPFSRPHGCQFHPRCDMRIAGVCDKMVPDLITIGEDREVRCLLHQPEIMEAQAASVEGETQNG